MNRLQTNKYNYYMFYCIVTLPQIMVVKEEKAVTKRIPIRCFLNTPKSSSKYLHNRRYIGKLSNRGK